MNANVFVVYVMCRSASRTFVTQAEAWDVQRPKGLLARIDGALDGELGAYKFRKHLVGGLAA